MSSDDSIQSEDDSISSRVKRVRRKVVIDNENAKKQRRLERLERERLAREQQFLEEAQNQVQYLTEISTLAPGPHPLDEKSTVAILKTLSEMEYYDEWLITSGNIMNALWKVQMCGGLYSSTLSGEDLLRYLKVAKLKRYNRQLLAKFGPNQDGYYCDFSQFHIYVADDTRATLMSLHDQFHDTLKTILESGQTNGCRRDELINAYY